MRHTKQLLEAVRAACVETALKAYEDGGFSGLCAEGRWECAIGAMRHFDVAGVIQQFDASASSENDI